MHKINKIKTYLKQDTHLIYISIFIGVLITTLITTISHGYSYEMQRDISNEIIRFHVLANSNSKIDQELKLNVKNSIIEMLAEELDKSTSTEETRILLINNLHNIQQKSQEVIKQYGFNDYSIDVKIAYDYFPTKIYGDITLPAGKYECLKIEIGEAVGDNWWCVMFPPLCFVDITMEEVPEKDKELLKSSLTEEQYKLIYTERSSINQDNLSNLNYLESIEVKVKFKIIELWQELINN